MIGGWVAALIVGLICYLVAPHVPHPFSVVLRIVGIVLLVLAVILFIFWLLAFIGVATAVGVALLV